MAKTSLTPARLRELLQYDPESGRFTWLVATSPRVKVGATAGTLKKIKGYVYIGIDGRQYKAHRLVFLYMLGQWPVGQVDHISCIRNDNRWSNLRTCSASENTCNRHVQKNNKLGVKGVFCRPDTGKFQATIGIGGKMKYLGLYSTALEAQAAYAEAARRLHKDFARY